MANLVFAGAGNVFPVSVRRNNCLRGTRPPYRTPAEDAVPLGYGNVTIRHENCDYFKDWLVFNTLSNGGSTPPGINTVTFGAFTTAPDGTTDTARKIVESTDNTEHSVHAGMQNDQFRWWFGNVRFAGVFKYAGRRIVMSIYPRPQTYADATPPFLWGSRAVFDLANGQVAVEHAAFGPPIIGFPPHYSPPWQLSTAHIEPVGDSWYLCYIDANAHVFFGSGLGSNSLFCKLSLDNGTGTDAISNTYTGDGTSGVYAWRGNLLPKRAWDMRRTAFFDDFNTSANMDLENTVAEGYDWYVKGAYPSFDFDMSQFPSTVTVSGGVVTMTSNLQYTLQTFASTWDQPSYVDVPRPLTAETANYSQGYVGNNGLGFALPAIFENRARWAHGCGGSFWSHSSEWLIAGRNQDPEGLIKGTEVDFWELLATSSYHPRLHFHHYPAGPDLTGAHQLGEVNNTPLPFIPKWGTGVNYNIGDHAHYLGVRYTSLVFTSDQIPLGNPTYWSAYNPTDTISTITPMVNWIDDFHTYSVMWFPYVSEEEPGQIYIFFDGRYAGTAGVYGPHINVDNGSDLDIFHLSDGYHVPLFLGLASEDDTKKLECEFVRVMQNG